MLAALSLTMALPASTALAEDGLLLTSDYINSRIRITDMATEKVVYDFSLHTAQVSPLCVLDNVACTPMGMNYVNYNDRDYLDVAVSWPSFRGGSLTTFLPSAIGRFELTRPAPRRVFFIEHLDFRDVPNHEVHCDQAEDELFGSPRTPGCTMQLAHGFDTVVDDPRTKDVAFVIADALNGRILQISHDYSVDTNVGHVDWVLGDDNPDWPVNGLPNAAKYIDDPDGPFLLVTFYTNGELEDATAGSLTMFRMTEDGWRKAWQFPDPNSGDEPWLQAAHMGQVLTDPTSGRRFIFYAHGRALATDWGTNANIDLGGAMGVLKPGASLADQPVYLGEAVPFLPDAFENPSFRYARDVEFLADGRLLFSDAACENLCAAPGKHFLVEPFHIGRVASSKAGYFSPDHREQELINLSAVEVIETLECGHGGVFESQWLSAGEVGRHLRKATQDATILCADEAEDAQIDIPTLGRIISPF